MGIECASARTRLLRFTEGARARSGTSGSERGARRGRDATRRNVGDSWAAGLTRSLLEFATGCSGAPPAVRLGTPVDGRAALVRVFAGLVKDTRGCSAGGRRRAFGGPSISGPKFVSEAVESSASRARRADEVVASPYSEEEERSSRRRGQDKAIRASRSEVLALRSKGSMDLLSPLPESFGLLTGR